MKEIILSGKIGGIALVDDSDYQAVANHVWWADKKRHTVYAYTQTLLNGKRQTVRMHQMILGINDADHADGDGLNNQRYNLRPATRNQQAHNSRGSGPYMKGVTKLARLNKRPWQARIAVNGKHIHLGYFATEKEAATAYDIAAKQLHKNFAKINGVTVPLSDNKRRNVLNADTVIFPYNGRNGRRSGYILQLLDCGHSVQSPLRHATKLGKQSYCYIC